MTERVFNLPDLGEGLEDAEIVEWKVAPGDTVELNQPLVEVNTAKALVEIPSPIAGVVATLHGEAGDVVDVGAPLVTFTMEGEPPSEAPAGTAQESPKRQAVLVGYGVDEGGDGKRRRPRLTPPGPRRATAAEAAPAEAPATGIRTTPPVRKLARERGVDLSGVSGSGPGGRITREDVLQAEGGAGTRPTPVEATAGVDDRVPLRGVRRLIAQRMTRSWREIPHVTTFHAVDATHLDALRRELTEESGTKVSALAVVVRALVAVCRDHPKLNASLDAEAGELVLRRSYHVGIAADTDRGLLVPVVRDVEGKGIAQVAREMADVIAAARDGTATPEQLTGSTITVSNYGVFGSDAGTPIINYPESSILGMGRIAPKALVVDGRVEARPAVTLALSFDHRIMDGAEADRAMTELREILESPFRLGALPR
jgi:pyruvate/2-oxoglutarate dehydrogenase complex dihydrolipoamide acyltransferase (E2) component